MKPYLLFFIFASSFFLSNAQSDIKDQDAIEKYTQSVGSMTASNIAYIADTLTRIYSNKNQKAFSLYSWIAHNIELDPKTTRSNDHKNSDPAIVIQMRKTTPFGLATLFQEMCSMANIRCLVVNGYTKKNTDDINTISDAPNHSWNVVQLGQSSHLWYYIDVSKACGTLDKKQTIFKPFYSAGYFFPNRKLFNLDHFAENPSWQLGISPQNLKEFYSTPLINDGAYLIGLQNFSPKNGYIKAETENSIRFNFKHLAATKINSIF